MWIPLLRHRLSQDGSSNGQAITTLPSNAPAPPTQSSELAAPTFFHTLLAMQCQHEEHHTAAAHEKRVTARIAEKVLGIIAYRFAFERDVRPGEWRRRAAARGNGTQEVPYDSR